MAYVRARVRDYPRTDDEARDLLLRVIGAADAVPLPFAVRVHMYLEGCGPVAVAATDRGFAAVVCWPPGEVGIHVHPCDDVARLEALLDGMVRT
jgi:hypothetical protein